MSEVLLYDRLIIPVPDPNDNLAEVNWVNEGWQPDVLHECLDVLKVKTDKADGLALTITWDNSKRERFKSRMSMAVALAMQRRDPEQTYYMDPFQMTRMLVKDAFLPTFRICPTSVSTCRTRYIRQTKANTG